MIEFILICSLAFYGFKVAQGEGMIFHSMSEKLTLWFEDGYPYTRRNTLTYIYKRPIFIRSLRLPLYDCPKCMPSIWGTVAYWISYYDTTNPLYYLIAMWLLCIFAMVGAVNILMYQFPFDD